MKTIMQRHGSIVLMLLAQFCSAILATIGRILRTGHGGDDSEARGTSEVNFLMTIEVRNEVLTIVDRSSSS